MNYTSMSFSVLKKLYDIHVRMALECPDVITECDHAERHAIAAELDRRNEGGDYV